MEEPTSATPGALAKDAEIVFSVYVRNVKKTELL